MSNGLIFVIITSLLFTTHEPVSKLFANEINPYAITAIRFFIGSIVLLPFAIRQLKKSGTKLTKKDLLIMGGLGIFVICVIMVLLQSAIKIADSPALIAIVFSSNSIFTIVFSAIFLKTKMSKTNILGVVLCVIGVLIASDFSQGSNLLSVVLALLAAILFSVYSILCKKYTSKFGAITQTGITFFIGSAVLLLILLITGTDIVGGITASNILPLLYISVLVTGLGYCSYFTAIKRGGPQMAAISYFIKPMLSPFAAFIINGIVPDISIILALVLVVVGIILTTDIVKMKKAK